MIRVEIGEEVPQNANMETAEAGDFELDDLIACRIKGTAFVQCRFPAWFIAGIER